MKNKITLVVFGILIILGLGISFFIFSKNDDFKTIRVTDPKAVGGALFHIALEKGYFEKRGIKVEVIKVQTGDEAIRAILSNSADIALGGIIPYSFLALDDQSIKIFAVNSYVGDNQIIANRRSGIEKPGDLKGKKIGYSKTTASDIGIVEFLSAHNMSTKDVSLINLKPLAMAGALHSGQIDAYSSWEPHVFNGKKLLGDNALIFSEKEDIYTWHQALMAKDSYIKANHRELVKFVEAMIDAEEFVSTDKNGAIALASKHNNVPPDTLADIWSKYDFSISLRDDIYKIIETDLLWANSQRENKSLNIPSSKSLVVDSVIKDVK